MDEFERQLAKLPLARPSAGLKQRIFGGMDEQVTRRSWLRGVLRHGVSLGWAASLAVAAGLAGALIVGSSSQPDKPLMMIPAEQTVTIQLESEKNVFDFTRTNVESIYDDVDVAVTTDEEA
jgi:hypothetical protein